MNQQVLPSFNEETLSTNNSSTANLAAAASFTGAADNVDDFASVGVTFFADQAFTIQVQQSSNGTNWDVTDSYTVAASTGDARTFGLIAEFCRVIATNNGGSTTTALRLQSVFTPSCATEPRALTQLGNKKVAIIESIPAGGFVIGGVNQGAPTASASGGWPVRQAGLDVSGNYQYAKVDVNGLQVKDVIALAMKTGIITVGTTPVQLAVSGGIPMVDRKFVHAQPTNGVIYWGSTSGVTASGLSVFKNQAKTWACTDKVPVWVVAAVSGITVGVAEGS